VGAAAAAAAANSALVLYFGIELTSKMDCQKALQVQDRTHTTVLVQHMWARPNAVSTTSLARAAG
jgi:hypothetical protein